MKNRLLFILLMQTIMSVANAQDLPGPPASSTLLPRGSYVIAMDNTYQLNTAGMFNLKAYGLVVHLLNNGVKVKWVIRAGKSKDGIDFTVLTNRLRPNVVADGLSRGFKGGPFVV